MVAVAVVLILAAVILTFGAILGGSESTNFDIFQGSVSATGTQIFLLGLVTGLLFIVGGKTLQIGARRARQRDVRDAFVAAAPRPPWWDAVDTPYRVDTVGDLLAAWQGHPRSDDGERQFFKAAYQGILDHPDDEHVVATAIDLLYWVVRDYPHRLPLAQFGYERYFRHRRRTDNCANCMPGDTTQGLAQNLSRLLSEAGRHDEAVTVCRRLIEERGAEVSPYKLAETWDRIAWAHWEKGERERALEVVREALAKYGETVRGDDLRRTLAHFEREK